MSFVFRNELHLRCELKNVTFLCEERGFQLPESSENEKFPQVDVLDLGRLDLGNHMQVDWNCKDHHVKWF